MKKNVIVSLLIITMLVFTGCSKTIENEDNKVITNYEECVAAGNPTTGIPAQCKNGEDTFVEELSLKESCEILNNGNWLADSLECEGISKDVCENLGGNFNECASACRNDPNAEICTMQCVLVCDFKKQEQEQEQPPRACTREYMPVCGVDGITYSNKCTAGDIEISYEGECLTE